MKNSGPKNKMPTGQFPMDLSNGRSSKSGRFTVPTKNSGAKNKMPMGQFPMDLSNGNASRNGRFNP